MSPFSPWLACVSVAVRNLSGKRFNVEHVCLHAEKYKAWCANRAVFADQQTVVPLLSLCLLVWRGTHLITQTGREELTYQWNHQPEAIIFRPWAL